MWEHWEFWILKYLDIGRVVFWTLDLKIVRLFDYEYLRVLSHKNLGLENEENFKFKFLEFSI